LNKIFYKENDVDNILVSGTYHLVKTVESN